MTSILKYCFPKAVFIIFFHLFIELNHTIKNVSIQFSSFPSSLRSQLNRIDFKKQIQIRTHCYYTKNTKTLLTSYVPQHSTK